MLHYSAYCDLEVHDLSEFSDTNEEEEIQRAITRSMEDMERRYINMQSKCCNVHYKY